MTQSRRDEVRRIPDQRRSKTSLHTRAFPVDRECRELACGITSSTLQNRENFQIIENGVNLTPKFLNDRTHPPIKQKQLNAFDSIGMSQIESTSRLVFTPPGNEMQKMTSMSLIKSSSMQTSVLSFNETIEGLPLSAPENGSLQKLGLDEAPSQFCLSKSDSGIFNTDPENVLITLKESATFFLFEMPQLTEDLNSPEGLIVKEANERYEQITSGENSTRKLVNAETQVPRIHTKARSTYFGQERRQNRGTFVNNWVFHDTHANSESVANENQQPEVDSSDPPTQIINIQEENSMLAYNKSDSADMNVQTYLAQISDKKAVRDAIRIIERIIASNLYIIPQKRFKGLIQRDPYSLDLEFTYSLDLLWTHSCPLTEGREVSCVKWNPVNTNLLAAGYGASPSSKNGILLIWCMKNPDQPERIYEFNSPISDADWSRKKPNQLAIGFYDGSIIVIDVSKKGVVALRKSSRLTSPSYSPHWQVQWWLEDEQYDYQEQIYTSNQDGRITRYRNAEDFTSSEIMRISRIEGQIDGIKRTNYSYFHNIPISRNPGAVLLRKHPDQSTIYFVGTDEGSIHRCSTNYLHQHIDSFLAHDGSVYSLEFSPFCSKIFLTCGADSCTRIWADAIVEPLITLSTQIACVRGAAWCPVNSTVIASIVNNEICIWDIKRKTYRPTSITVSSNSHAFSSIQFTSNGKQLVAADVNGDIHIYNLEGMPFPPLDQQTLLVKSIEKTLVTKSALLRKLKKSGSPF